ncbi:salviol synthase-like [Salvia divinorum]|uniref:Salviol synthase-like n=1 Tax=Salvia divinorum TaxID=28513 RepID=A0ABD1I2N2_SALDI
MANAWAIGRDPKQWGRMLLEASVDFIGNDFEFIPFGAGRSVCPRQCRASAGDVSLSFQLESARWHQTTSTSNDRERNGWSKDDLMAVPTVKIPLQIL